jgi:hypothetical protein
VRGRVVPDDIFRARGPSARRHPAFHAAVAALQSLQHATTALTPPMRSKTMAVTRHHVTAMFQWSPGTTVPPWSIADHSRFETFAMLRSAKRFAKRFAGRSALRFAHGAV